MNPLALHAPPSLAEWLRTRRLAVHLTQGALGARLEEFGGCNQSNISTWELGDAIPDAGQIVALTRAMGVFDPAEITLRDDLALVARRQLAARRLAPSPAPIPVPGRRRRGGRSAVAPLVPPEAGHALAD